MQHDNTLYIAARKSILDVCLHSLISGAPDGDLDAVVEVIMVHLRSISLSCSVETAAEFVQAVAMRLSISIHMALTLRPESLDHVLDFVCRICSNSRWGELAQQLPAAEATTSASPTAQEETEGTVVGDSSTPLPSSAQAPQPLAGYHPAHFPHCLLLSILQGMNHRGAEQREHILTTLAARCRVPEAVKTEVLTRHRIRRNQLFCKSIAPRLPSQVPDATASLVAIFRRYLGAPFESSRETHALRSECYRILSSAQVHPQYLCTVIVRCLLSLSACRIRRATDAPVLSELFTKEHREMLSTALLEFVPAMFSEVAGTAHQDSEQVAAKKSACVLYAHGFLSVQPTMALYFGCLLFGPKPQASAGSSDAQVQSALFDATLERAAKVARDMAAYVEGTRSEIVFAASGGGGGAAAAAGGCARKSRHSVSASKGTPMNGELSQPQMFHMTHAAPPPTWNELLSKTEAKNIPWRAFPVSMLGDLLALQCYNAAARFIIECKEVVGVDVFLYRGDGIEVTAATAVSDHISLRLHAASKGSSTSSSSGAAVQCVIADVLGLLRVAHTDISSVPFIWTLMNAAITAWGTHPSDAIHRRETLLELIACVLLPSLRVLEPSLPLYSALNRLFALLNDSELLAPQFLPSASSVPRKAMDLLMFKEMEAGLNSSLKRMTLESVDYYRAFNRRLLYSNPLYVAERLFQQAIGYENAYVMVHAQLLTGAPACVLTMVSVRGIHMMRKFAAEEREGSENRISIIASLLCAIWRFNPKTFDGAMLLREVDRAYRRGARESIVFGNEVLKAACLQLLGTVCETEEQYNAQQLASLVSCGDATRWFGRGTAASFLGLRFHPVHFNPQTLLDAKESFAAALISPLSAAKASSVGSHGAALPNPGDVAVCVGTSILLQLCKLSTTTYELLADLSGTMESVLLECGKYFNAMNDLITTLAPMLQHTQVPSVKELADVANPALVLKLSCKLPTSIDQFSKAQGCDINPSVKSDELNDTTDGASDADNLLRIFSGQSDRYTAKQLSLLFSMTHMMPLEEDSKNDNEEVLTERTLASRHTAVQCVLAGLAACHLEFERSTYDHALREARAFSQRLESAAASNKVSRKALASSLKWAVGQPSVIEEECRRHNELTEGARCVVDKFLVEHVVPWLRRDGLHFVRCVVLPRILLSLDDVMFVGALFRRLVKLTLASLTQPTPDVQPRLTETDLRCLVDAMLVTVTAIMTFFVSFSDGESKRCGSTLAIILQLLDDITKTYHRRATSTESHAADSGHSDGAPDSAAVSPLRHQVFAARCRQRQSAARLETLCSVTPAYVLETDAFLAQAFHQVLAAPDGRSQDIASGADSVTAVTTAPQFSIRNAFIILERIKAHFPHCRETAAVMTAAVRRHNDKNSAYFAAASAQMKLYVSIIANAKGSGSSSYMSFLLDDLNVLIKRETEAAVTLQEEQQQQLDALESPQTDAAVLSAPTVDAADVEAAAEPDAADDDGDALRSDDGSEPDDRDASGGEDNVSQSNGGDDVSDCESNGSSRILVDRKRPRDDGDQDDLAPAA